MEIYVLLVVDRFGGFQGGNCHGSRFKCSVVNPRRAGGEGIITNPNARKGTQLKLKRGELKNIIGRKGLIFRFPGFVISSAFRLPNDLMVFFILPLVFLDVVTAPKLFLRRQKRDSSYLFIARKKRFKKKRNEC